MNKIHEHSKIDNKYIILFNIIALIPLLLYGFYKNIYIVYKRGLISSTVVTKSIFCLIIVITVPIVIDIIYSKIKKEKIINYINNSYSLVYSLIYYLIMPPRFNFIIFFIGLLLTQIISKIQIKFNINFICLIKLLIIILLSKNAIYPNIYESTKDIYYNLFDSFFGRTIGSFGTTNIFLILLSYAFLSLTNHYKKEIPLIATISFFVFGISYYIITKDSGFKIFNDFITTNFIFCVVFISTISFYSPYTNLGKYIYSILLGALSFIALKFISIYEGVLIVILILSIIVKPIDDAVLKITNRQRSKN